MRKYLLLIAFLATIPAANWLIGNVGAICIPTGPCLVPVWPGIMAPSGVFVIGVALVLRDAIHDRFGVNVALLTILVGAAISAFVSPAPLALASLASFAVSELSDLAVYAPLRRRGRVIAAVLASGVVGAAVDSGLFLLIAFGSLDYMSGQVIGKLYASVAAAAVIMALQNKRRA